MQTEHPTKLDRLMHAVAEHHPVRAAVEIAVDSFRVRVESNSAELIASLRDYYRPYLASLHSCELCIVAIETRDPDLGLTFKPWPRDPYTPQRLAEYVDIDGGRVVRRGASGLQFLVGPDLTLAVGGCVKHRNQISDFIAARYAERLQRRGWLMCRAAAIAHGARGLGICGAGDAGKSTLALHAVARGASFVSNDRVLVRETGGARRMAGEPKQPRVNAAALLEDPALRGLLQAESAAQLEQRDRCEPRRSSEQRDVDIEQCFGRGRRQLAADLLAFVFLNWRPGEAGRMQVARSTLAQRSELLPLIAKRPGPFCGFQPSPQLAGEDWSGRHAARYLAQLGDLPVFELSGQVDFAAATELCLELLGRARLDLC